METNLQDMETCQARPHETLAWPGQVQTPPHAIWLEDIDGAGRPALEQFVARAYHKAHGASLSHFLPHLLALGEPGLPKATVGLQAAGNRPLFLEAYLDRPVENEISKTSRHPVWRHQIVEIGNLAVNTAGASVVLFTVLAAILRKAGFRWAVFTATRRVEEILCRMQFDPQAICDADPARLPDKGRSWGSYYDNSPRVIVGDIRAAYRHARRDPRLSEHLHLHRVQIARVGQTLRAPT